MPSRARVAVLGVLLLAGAAAIFLFNRPDTSNRAAVLLDWVATAQQRGVVGYRDPVGAISPDGTRLAYSEGAYVRVVPVSGGASPEFPAAEGQVRHLAWIAGAVPSLLVEDTRGDTRWWRLDPDARTRVPLFGDRPSLTGAYAGTGGTAEVRTNSLRSLAPSPDGQVIAAVAAGSDGAEVWRIARDGTHAEVAHVSGRVSWPAWRPAGDLVCIVTTDGRSRITSPCGGPALTLSPDIDAVGPIAFSPDGAAVYFASPNDRGTVDLWSADWTSGAAVRLTRFSRDTYAPSVAADGTVLFKTQSYRTFVSEIDLATGQSRQLAAFQSETPSYSPDGRLVALTYGTWRRVMDDGNYPDIAQEIGTVPADPGAAMAAAPGVITTSVSEDQAMTWSPNGRWIAFHSHREMSDDIWLRPADGSLPDRRITFLGRGAEVGWPRWSPDGRQVLFDGADPDTGHSVIYVIPVDQETGETGEARQVIATGLAGDLQHPEWFGGSDAIVALTRVAGGQYVIFSVPASGGFPRILRRFASEHDFAGLAASPDGREVAFIQRAPDGYFQVFRLAAGSEPVQVTTDPSHKTQPAWSPDGTRIAYTTWNYQAQFWALTPAGRQPGP